MSNNFNYEEVLKEVGEHTFNEALAHCRTIAAMEEFKPTYFTTAEAFLPHAWVIAAVSGLIGMLEE